MKNKKKQYRQSGITLFTMLKTLDSYLYMKSKMAKSQLWISSSISEIEYMKKQQWKWARCVSQSRSSRLTNLLTFSFESSLQKWMKQWNLLPMSTLFWTNSKNRPKFCETSCLLIIVNLNYALWCFVCLLIEILLVQKYFCLWSAHFKLGSLRKSQIKHKI